MIDFLAEAAVLLGLLAYGRNWREQPGPEEPAEREEPAPEPRRREPERPRAKAPPAAAEERNGSVLENVADAAAKMWNKLGSWRSAEVEEADSTKPTKPATGGAWGDSPAGKPLWTGPSPFKAPSRPAQGPPAGQSRPDPPANGRGQHGAAAGSRPATVRCPTCGTELPWARAVSLRLGSETLYFCSPACKTLYSKGQGT